MISNAFSNLDSSAMDFWLSTFMVKNLSLFPLFTIRIQMRGVEVSLQIRTVPEV